MPGNILPLSLFRNKKMKKKKTDVNMEVQSLSYKYKILEDLRETGQ